MELIGQHTKRIMEGCKERAREAGLRFQDETLEYIVTNRDLLELSPKMMIPTLYDYWVHDVEVLKERGKYELYPHNPYETVINTRPPISFYNDNNPDWLNVMIFYHVLAHIDFFQNNLYFRHTWDYDFTGKALSDKRLVNKMRSEHGRWVDYVIEFARSVDNLVGYHKALDRLNTLTDRELSDKTDFFFDVFIQEDKKLKISEYIKEIERYNQCIREDSSLGEQAFFLETEKKYPEFTLVYRRYLEKKSRKPDDLLQYILDESEFLKKDLNNWMKPIIELVRQTSIFIQPQIRTKIMNEGWASYWHEKLFLRDERIKGHVIDFARVNAKVTALSRVGLNPYALGMRMFHYIEDLADKGRRSITYRRLTNARERSAYNIESNQGPDFLFDVRENYSDFLFINAFIDQDFIDRYKLFVAGRKLDTSRMVYQYYIKSRKAEDYRAMIMSLLYHPPHVEIDHDRSREGELYLAHRFEGKPLVSDYIPNTMIGIEYLWGAAIHLETSEVAPSSSKPTSPAEERDAGDIKWQRVLYTMKDRKIAKKVIQS